MAKMAEDNAVLLPEGASPSFSQFNGDDHQFPVLISVPHAGRDYPPAIRDNLAVPAASLIRLEDRYADRLVTGAIAAGYTTMVAREPRAWIDLNRGHRELDPDMLTGVARHQLPEPSRKVRGGLGLVPRRLNGTGELWRRKWVWDEVCQRVDHSHAPYHRLVERTLDKMREKFGGAILLDVHSMPPLTDGDQGDVDIVIGDRFGRSSGSRYSEIAMGYCNQAGLRGQLNHPYAGGYILERHGQPDQGIHALQLEVDRRCYLDGALLEPGEGLPAMIDHVTRIANLLANQSFGQVHLIAAE
ncbi:N-formylglutamate amidohydrolase [Parasphingorhabdus marina DSM 22363]|uniref:N-formylglutamate amidohydrolase n=2 Tax=Parasphingorhabdus marina TaxID=394732 RepID=A0A1N6CME2_9SPHN|nr:N-formylglutamate amidohydrolase [Parasphingorhabdus marina DSM 22363]